MRGVTRVNRRDFLFRPRPAADDAPAGFCISSAVVTARPDRMVSVLQALAAIGGITVHACQGHRLVLVLEGESGDALGALLARIAGVEGVLAANMVFEHFEPQAEPREEVRNGAVTS